MLFDNEINVCAISAIRQFDVAEATATATIVDQYIIRFDICYQESGAVRRCSGAMASHVPVCTIPSSCKAASACNRAFATRFTSEDRSFLVADSIKRLLSRCSKTSKGGNWTSSITWRRDDISWKRLRISRSLRKEKSGAVLRMTFCLVCVSLQQIRRCVSRMCDGGRGVHSPPYISVQLLRNKIIALSAIRLTTNWQGQSGSHPSKIPHHVIIEVWATRLALF